MGHPALHTTTPAPGQVARKYQEEIFRQAQKGNVIAYLRTGLGKTLISVLLIKWMSTQQHAINKRIFFLVPKVTLVEQQSQYIEKETGLKTCRLHGAMGLDFADRDGWRKRLEEHSIFVVTAQLFLEMVTHSTWSVDKCSLLIFDECHHARKNHPYNGIMREYREIKEVSKRPKVFGMTASPYWNQKNPILSIQTLEENLDAKVIGVQEHVAELEQHYSKFEEVIEQYEYPPEIYNFYEPTLFKCIKTFQANDPGVFDNMEISWNKIEMRYYTTLNNLGPYCASLFLFSEIRHHMNTQLQRAQAALAVSSHHEAMSVDTDATNLPPIVIFDILEVMDGYEPFFLSPDDTLPLNIPMDWCSPKLQKLVEILKSHLQNPIQTIIFVEQRQTASCLARVLEAIQDLKGIVRCGYLVGVTRAMEGLSKWASSSAGDPVQLFREKKINVLIATSVAEEGLDFPACELVIRFDPLQHLVGYVQSRGRARSEVSKYVVMIQKENVAQLERYLALQRGEMDLSATYNRIQPLTVTFEADGDEYDDELRNLQDDDPVDLSQRERYVVPSTGAVLTYDNAIGLINNLCALIPHDAFTPTPKPVYTGAFQSRLKLPAGLPLEPKHRVYLGYPKRTKKEAKRSAAFQAVKRLLRMNVFNEYLLPTSRTNEEVDVALLKKDSSGKQKALPPDTMDADVKDPWCIAATLWLHPLVIRGKKAAAIITSTSLPPIDMTIDGTEVLLHPATPFHLDRESEAYQRRVMEEFTSFGIFSRITAKRYTGKQSFYLIPLDASHNPDFDFMELIIDNQKGFRDWNDLRENDDDEIWAFNWNQHGRYYLLKRLRYDLTPQSVPPPGSREAGGDSSTYYDYFAKKWKRKKRAALVPESGPLLETVVLERVDVGAYDLQSRKACPRRSFPEAAIYLVPRDCCNFLPFPAVLSKAFEVLPVLCRGITDLYRSREARFTLNLPAIDHRLITEALTIPGAMLKFNNQRLETIGDAVLQLCTTIHLLNQYPHRHEGQLSDLRQRYVSNNFLLRQALALGLDEVVTSEVSSVHKWRYVLKEERSDYGYDDKARRYVSTSYPRRSLQDCMEALLGASYLQGGIDLALHAGAALGLEFGGPLPWFMRYRRVVPEGPVTVLFETLQDRLGYRFRSNDLLVEAVTHPSFVIEGENHSYQRLEFLGDAILDLVVVDYLYRKFPTATSHQLSFLRAKVVRAPALAYLAVKQLSLNKVMLMNNLDLYKAIDAYVGVFESISGDEIVDRGWKYDPPKPISDVLESVIGGILVDSGYDYEKTAALTKALMLELLEELDLSSAKDPVSGMVEWLGKEGCLLKPVFHKPIQTKDSLSSIGVSVEVHGVHIVGPIAASSASIAKFLAAERAHAILADESSQYGLRTLCDCRNAMDIDKEDTTEVEKSTCAVEQALPDDREPLGMDQGDD